jgi:hypothetical protein
MKTHFSVPAGLLTLIFFIAAPGRAQTQAKDASDFDLVLPSHAGQLQWHAQGFVVSEVSVEPRAREIGVRGQDQTGHLLFEGFLSILSGPTTLTSAACRDTAIEKEKKNEPSFKSGTTSELTRPDGLSVELVSYMELGDGNKPVYSERGFIATGDICGDLEIYSTTPLSDTDPALKEIWGSLRLNPTYEPQFDDIFQYAQILFENHKYEAAGPFFELALTEVKEDNTGDNQTWRRVTTDQAGMSYGVSGNFTKARAIFEAAIVKDPNYPLYYYNLACADAGEMKLDDARAHLRQAFDRKANVLTGEKMPDPTMDDTFLPYKDNKDFWTFLESLTK